jgi:hypothetical protein
MTSDDSLSPYEIFEGTPWEAGLLQSILTDNEIESILRDTTSYPWNTIPVDGGTAKVFVALKDLDKTKAIVDEFTSNLNKENEPEDPDLKS